MKQFSVADVAKHNKASDCWVIINGKVLDLTSFLAEHPGGKEAILMFAGKDASEDFNMMHTDDYLTKYVKESILGTVAGASKL